MNIQYKTLYSSNLSNLAIIIELKMEHRTKRHRSLSSYFG